MIAQPVNRVTGSLATATIACDTLADIGHTASIPLFLQSLMDNGSMHIEILHIEDCANWVETGQRVRQALDEVGLIGVTIDYRLISNSQEAARVPFAGSPTILVDGKDAFPTDGRTSDLACRIYRTDDGIARMPTVTQLREVFGVVSKGTPSSAT